MITNQGLKLRKSKMFVLDLLECNKDLTSPQNLITEIIDILKRNNITVLQTNQQIFPPYNGATIIFILSESHLAIHTWPEKRLVNLDLFLCNFRKNNEEKVKNTMTALRDYFQPKTLKLKSLVRIN